MIKSLVDSHWTFSYYLSIVFDIRVRSLRTINDRRAYVLCSSVDASSVVQVLIALLFTLASNAQLCQSSTRPDAPYLPILLDLEFKATPPPRTCP